MKECSKCSITKPLALFKKEKRSKDGHRSECKECSCSLGKEYRLREPWRHLWNSMLYRCNNSIHPQYKDYGGRGINVCKEWASSYSIFKHWCINNGYKRGLELDRRENDFGYSPENCRFVTTKVNANNKKRKMND